MVRSSSRQPGADYRQLVRDGFARHLRAILNERGLTARETARRVREHLGEGAKFTAANISHYCVGRSLPRPQYLDALGFVLGVTTDELLSEKPPPRERKSGRRSTAESPSREIDGHLPSLHIIDQGGSAWLQINQQVPWPAAIQILNALKGETSAP